MREEGRSSGCVAGSCPFYVYVYGKGQDPAAATPARTGDGLIRDTTLYVYVRVYVCVSV